jgi:prepilin-type N-terminal cleavage/methylation domain-containing protein
MLKQLKKKRNQKGFTLVELLVVIAIIGILAAIAIPQFNMYRNQGYVASVKADAKNAYTAVQAYIADHPGVTPPAAATLPTADYPGGRLSPGNTITIASGGQVTVTGNPSYTTGSYIIAETGAITDTIKPK